MNFKWMQPIHHEERSGQSQALSPDPHQGVFSKNVFGFWLYLMTDCLIFATLFATYAILHQNSFGGPTSHEIFQLPLAFAETMILLLSSLTCGLAILAAVKQKKEALLLFLGLSFLLGASFIGLEISEFSELIHQGFSWRVSAFLSSYFTLVGTHGLHVSVGLFWMGVLALQIVWQGLSEDTFRRLVIFGLFWHFLDVIWIFIFSFVYLMGSVP